MSGRRKDTSDDPDIFIVLCEEPRRVTSKSYVIELYILMYSKIPNTHFQRHWVCKKLFIWEMHGNSSDSGPLCGLAPHTHSLCSLFSDTISNAELKLSSFQTPTCVCFVAWSFLALRREMSTRHTCQLTFVGLKFLMSAPLIITLLLNRKLGRKSTCGGKGKGRGAGWREV